MKNYLLYIFIIITMATILPLYSQNADSSNQEVKTSSDFYNFKLITLQGDTIPFSDFKSKKVLLVNVASKCGYTPQYAQLQELHEKYWNKVVIIGFPANNFGSQEPGTNSDVLNFCTKNYGVTFLMSEKISVKGLNQHPIFQWLTNKSRNGWNQESPQWNFYKYLMDEEGHLRKVFPSSVLPTSEEIVNEILDFKK